MKQTIHITLALAAAVLLFSCSKLNQPKTFDDSQSFIGFSQYTYNVAEDAGTLKIPVSLSSMSGLTATVAFTTIDSSAKKGVDFDIIGDGTLSFNSDKRTDTIRLKINDNPGVYTKDKVFFLTLEPALGSGVNKGYNDTVTVSINDLDHPLTPILGKWTASAEDYWDGPSSWIMELRKDKEDDHKVWVFNIANLGGNASEKLMFYGVVNEQMTMITIPIGQVAEAKYSGSDIKLANFSIETEEYTFDGKSIFKLSDDGKAMMSETGFGVIAPDVPAYFALVGNVSCVKQ